MREFGAGGLLREMRQCSTAGVESESELPLFSFRGSCFANCLPSTSRPSYIQQSLFFFFVLLSPHFPVYINSVIMWVFIWLIKASSFWAISQRTWIKLPYLCTGATVGSAKAYSTLCRLWRGKKHLHKVVLWKWYLENERKYIMLTVGIKGSTDRLCYRFGKLVVQESA